MKVVDGLISAARLDILYMSHTFSNRLLNNYIYPVSFGAALATANSTVLAGTGGRTWTGGNHNSQQSFQTAANSETVVQFGPAMARHSLLCFQSEAVHNLCVQCLKLGGGNSDSCRGGSRS